MRTRALFTSVLASLGILVTGWQLSTGNEHATTASTTAAVPAPQNGSAPAPGPGSATPAPGAAATGSGTYVGSTSTHRYGSVSVSVTVSAGTITDVTAKEGSQDSHSRHITSQAEPLLRKEVLAAQSSNIKMISGATYTSHAYQTSLQSALDQAGL